MSVNAFQLSTEEEKRTAELPLGHTNLVQTSTYLGIGKEEVLRARARHGAEAKVIADSAATNLNYHKLPHRVPKTGDFRKGGKQEITH